MRAEFTVSGQKKKTIKKKTAVVNVILVSAKTELALVTDALVVLHKTLDLMRQDMKAIMEAVTAAPVRPITERIENFFSEK